ncbi:MAG: TonB family protein [Terracidiphilus sp.]
MFEDSTFESTGMIRTRSRRWMLVTFALNASVLLALILIPLIYPEAIPSISTIMLLEAPTAPPEEPKPQSIPHNAVVVERQFDVSTFTAPPKIPTHIDYAPAPEVFRPVGTGIDQASGNNASPDNIFSGERRTQIVEAKPKGPTAVSSGVMQGLVIRQVLPNYPPIAKAAHLEGTVVLTATISKSGRIENLHVVSGPPMFTQAAMDAVAQWIYRPYLLNGQPVEVETTVNVVFKLE